MKDSNITMLDKIVLLKYSDYEGLDSCDRKITEINSLFKISPNEMDL